MKPYIPTSAGSTSNAITSLAALATALSGATDEQAILAKTLQFLWRFDLQAARLGYLHPDANGVSQVSRVAASWQADPAPPGGVQPADRYPINPELVAKLGLDKTAGPLLLTELDQTLPPGATPTGDDQTIGSPAAVKTMALLPLRSERDGGWQGFLALFWTEPHTFSPEESDAYSLLAAVLGLRMSGLHAERELGTAHEESALLHEVTKKLYLASSSEEILRALLLPAPFQDEAEVALCLIEPQPSGALGWLTVASAWTGSGQPGSSPIGARYYLPDIPFSKLYTSSPDAPLLISDIATDPRVDDYARSLYSLTHVGATIMMALTLQGRWVGLFNVTWKRPIPLTQREQRLYQSLAKQAALLLDNSLMVERLRTTLHETQQQSALQQTILDQIPVGVVLLDASTTHIVLNNAYAERILGRTVDKQIPGISAATVSTYRFLLPGTDTPLPTEDLAATRTMRSGKMETTEMDVLHASGERLHVQADAVPIHDAQGAVKQVIVLLSDLTTRKLAERERTGLQEEIIRVQAAALAERSSPLIPITDEILVLPLIGSIDAERGQQVLDTVLNGTSQRGARVAIIDITGVGTVDTQAAAALTGAAQALRLLGVEPVLTGIRAEVAQTLVSLGIELAGIVTRSTLQAGIQYALRRLGKPTLK